MNEEEILSFIEARNNKNFSWLKHETKPAITIIYDNEVILGEVSNEAFEAITNGNTGEAKDE